MCPTIESNPTYPFRRRKNQNTIKAKKKMPLRSITHTGSMPAYFFTGTVAWMVLVWVLACSGVWVTVTVLGSSILPGIVEGVRVVLIVGVGVAVGVEVYQNHPNLGVELATIPW